MGSNLKALALKCVVFVFLSHANLCFAANFMLKNTAFFTAVPPLLTIHRCSSFLGVTDSLSLLRDASKWKQISKHRAAVDLQIFLPCFLKKANSKIWVSGETWGTVGSLRTLTRTTKPWSRTLCQLGTPAQKTLEGKILCNCYSAALSK